MRKRHPDMVLTFGHGRKEYISDSDCWCICHAIDGKEKVKIGGHWHSCPKHHRKEPS